jgi:hypothetical protein
MTSFITILIIAFLAAILVDLFIFRWLLKKSQVRVDSPQDVKVFGVYSPVLTKIKQLFLRIFGKTEGKTIPRIFGSQEWKKLSLHQIEGGKFWIGIEILVIILWAFSFTIPFMDMDPSIIPSGNEYPSVIQANHMWTRFLNCGACFMWNGSIRGGTPAFVDPHSSMLHPLVVITTLIAGVQNGAKLSLIAIFIIAGLTQWWLAYTLGLGRIPRLWSGMMAVVGGHLASRMELGLFGMVLSTACVSLVIPALIWLTQNGNCRSIVFLGISLASAVLSGQGYMQLGLLSVLPATFLLVPWNTMKIKELSKRLALAGLIGFLISSPFLIPYLHFLPEFVKDTNPAFDSAQPIRYIPLNLVIGDHDFYRTEDLQKLPYPSIYENYIGWIPVILAIFALFGTRNPGEKRATRFLFSVVIITVWMASASPLKWIINNLNLKQLDDAVAGIRHPPYIFGMAVTAVLGLSAIGLDQILKRDWISLKFEPKSVRADSSSIIFDLRWLLAIPLLFSLIDARSYNEVWIYTTKVDPVIQEVNEAILPLDLQWVNPPYGQHEYIESAVGMGIKMSYGTQAWYWKNREVPLPVREASFSGDPIRHHKRCRTVPSSPRA